MRSKRLLFVCSSLDTGGAQKMLSNMVMAFPKDWDIDIVLNSDENIQYPYKGKIISLDISEPNNRQNLIYQFRVLIRRIVVLKSIRRKNKYVACISILDSSNIANILSSDKQSKTIITSVAHLVDINDQFVYKYIVFPLVRVFYNKADLMVVQTPQMKDDMVSFFKMKDELVRTIPTGIDFDAVEKIIKEPLVDDEVKVFDKNNTIITAGRLTRNKGQWHLIRAFSKVKKKNENARLVIFGEGELKDQLVTFTDRLALSDSVEIRPFNAKLDKYIANSAVFAFPSQYEGMPVALMEALACGTPCIITAFGAGAYDILGDKDRIQKKGVIEAEYGLISPLCNEEMDLESVELEPEEEVLADGIERLLLNPEYHSKYSKRAKERGRYYGMDNIIDEWIKAITE